MNRYEVLPYVLGGGGFIVADTERAPGEQRVAGPFPSRHGALAYLEGLVQLESEHGPVERILRSVSPPATLAEPETARLLVRVLEQLERTASTLASGLEGALLAQERYDTELRTVRERLDENEAQLERISRVLWPDNERHSVRA